MNLEDYKDVFEPFEKLIEIEILGKKIKVPENNSLLRCFQYLSIKTVSLGDFCWNGDCANCQVWLESNVKNKPVLSCRTTVKEGMKIVKMADEIVLEAVEFVEQKKPKSTTKTKINPTDSIF
jgi:NADH dehydrogenase/NADH:ubiquinone oxidoreductase subunit G